MNEPLLQNSHGRIHIHRTLHESQAILPVSLSALTYVAAFEHCSVSSKLTALPLTRTGRSIMSTKYDETKTQVTQTLRSHVPTPEGAILIAELPYVVHCPECSKPSFTFLLQEWSWFLGISHTEPPAYRASIALA